MVNLKNLVPEEKELISTIITSALDGCISINDGLDLAGNTGEKKQALERTIQELDKLRKDFANEVELTPYQIDQIKLCCAQNMRLLLRTREKTEEAIRIVKDFCLKNFELSI